MTLMTGPISTMLSGRLRGRRLALEFMHARHAIFIVRDGAIPAARGSPNRWAPTRTTPRVARSRATASRWGWCRTMVRSAR